MTDALGLSQTESPKFQNIRNIGKHVKPERGFNSADYGIGSSILDSVGREPNLKARHGINIAAGLNFACR